MPQLSKTNLVLMFISTWIALHLITAKVKKTYMESNSTDHTEKNKTTPWHWPYT